jgi:hypothetical protein
MREALLLQSRESLLQVLGDPLTEPSNPDVHHCRARQVLPGDIVDRHTRPCEGNISGLFGVGIKESQRDGGPPGSSDPLHDLLQRQPRDGLLVDLQNDIAGTQPRPLGWRVVQRGHNHHALVLHLDLSTDAFKLAFRHTAHQVDHFGC